MPGKETGDDIIAGAETIDLQGANSNGVLLLHGFGDTPQTLGLLAEHLHSAGFGVRAPLLPGHGRSVQAFVQSRRGDWLEFARHELAVFQERYSSVAIAGLSMGGAIACLLAAGSADLRALVLIAPYLGMRPSYSAISATSWLWGPLFGTVKSNSPRSIHDPVERAKNLGYGMYTGRLVYELWRLTTQARRVLPLIRTPTLLIQSKEDPRIATVGRRALLRFAGNCRQAPGADRRCRSHHHGGLRSRACVPGSVRLAGVAHARRGGDRVNHAAAGHHRLRCVPGQIPLWHRPRG